jgi:predicted DNA-binding transcriptional regulator AlpA
VLTLRVSEHIQLAVSELREQHVPDKIDPLLRARVVCTLLGGYSRRTLFELIKRGDFPAPDRKARKLGEPDLWLESTVRRGIASYAAAATPAGSPPPPPVTRSPPPTRPRKSRGRPTKVARESTGGSSVNPIP